MRKIFTLTLLVFALVTSAQLHARYTLHRIAVPEYTYGNGGLPFLQFLPPDYSTSGTRKFPLIIFLHGQGETGYGFPDDITRLTNVGLPKYLTNPNATMQFPDEHGTIQSFVVLVPQKHKETNYCPPGKVCPPNCSLTSPDCTPLFEAQWPAYYIDAMINYARDNIPNIDPNRIFLTGLSLGAGIVWDYPSMSDANARKIAGIVPVSGNPVLAYHKTGGVADLCNIAENQVRSRGYHGFAGIDPEGDSTDGGIKIDSPRRAQVHLNDTCPAPGKPYSELLISPGGHNDAFWNMIYDTAYGGTNPNLNMYRWMASISRASLTLPIELVYFKGKSFNNENVLNWATSKEMNFQRFEILRSGDGKEFKVIGSVNARDGSQQNDYSFTDNAAPGGLSHYKLKPIDKDGSYKFTSVVSLSKRSQAFAVEQYPNPAREKLNLNIEGKIFGGIEIVVLDLKGNIMLRRTVSKEQATWKGFINIQGLANGVYMLQVKGANGDMQLSRFVKQ